MCFVLVTFRIAVADGSAERAWQLTQLAEVEARAGNCARVAELRSEVAELDRAMATDVFDHDVAIARCEETIPALKDAVAESAKSSNNGIGEGSATASGAESASADGIVIESEYWYAQGISGAAAAADGHNARVAARYVWNPYDEMQLRFGASLGTWFGVAPYGTLYRGSALTSWTTATFNAEATWLVSTNGLRVGPELGYSPPSLSDSNGWAPRAISIGARVRYKDLSVGAAFEHAWPTAPDYPYPYSRGSNSIAVGIGLGGKLGLVAAGVIAIVGLAAAMPAYHDN
jgi:hypothetical protein